MPLFRGSKVWAEKMALGRLVEVFYFGVFFPALCSLVAVVWTGSSKRELHIDSTVGSWDSNKRKCGQGGRKKERL